MPTVKKNRASARKTEKLPAWYVQSPVALNNRCPPGKILGGGKCVFIYDPTSEKDVEMILAKLDRFRKMVIEETVQYQADENVLEIFAQLNEHLLREAALVQLGSAKECHKIVNKRDCGNPFQGENENACVWLPSRKIIRKMLGVGGKCMTRVEGVTQELQEIVQDAKKILKRIRFLNELGEERNEKEQQEFYFLMEEVKRTGQLLQDNKPALDALAHQQNVIKGLMEDYEECRGRKIWIDRMMADRCRDILKKITDAQKKMVEMSETFWEKIRPDIPGHLRSLVLVLVVGFLVGKVVDLKNMGIEVGKYVTGGLDFVLKTFTKGVQVSAAIPVLLCIGGLATGIFTGGVSTVVGCGAALAVSAGTAYALN